MNQKNGAVFRASGAGAASVPASSNASTVVLRDVLPSSRLITADLGLMKIGRPDNWDVLSQGQQGMHVWIAPRAGLVTNGFGYGVDIASVAASRRNETIDQATTQIVNNLQSSQSEMKSIGNPTQITIGGVRGRSVIMQSLSPFTDAKGQSQKERDWLIAIPRQDGSFFSIVFVAPESEFGYFKPTFEKMLNSVQF